MTYAFRAKRAPRCARNVVNTQKKGRNFEQFIKFCELVRICVLRTPFGIPFAATHAILRLPGEMYSL